MVSHLRTRNVAYARDAGPCFSFCGKIYRRRKKDFCTAVLRSSRKIWSTQVILTIRQKYRATEMSTGMLVSYIYVCMALDEAGLCDPFQAYLARELGCSRWRKYGSYHGSPSRSDNFSHMLEYQRDKLVVQHVKLQMLSVLTFSTRPYYARRSQP
jgi:hypothetical protein